jgi:hypothetical protein
MASDDRSEMPVDQRDEALVPLAIGATAAYFEMAPKSTIVRNDDQLAEFAHLLAIALSTVAPIYMRTNPTADDLGDAFPLATQEINELLFGPVKEGRLRSTLDGLLIRRADLRRGIATLKAAQVAFGRN